MAKNKLSDLRDHLFETIEQLKDADKPMDITRAKAISDVAQTIINAAKVELEAAEVLGTTGDGSFFPQETNGKPRLIAGGEKAN